MAIFSRWNPIVSNENYRIFKQAKSQSSIQEHIFQPKKICSNNIIKIDKSDLYKTKNLRLKYHDFENRNLFLASMVISMLICGLIIIIIEIIKNI